MRVRGPLVVINLVPAQPSPAPLCQVLIQFPWFSTRLNTHIGITSLVAVVTVRGLGLPTLAQRGALTGDGIGDVGSGVVVVDYFIRIVRYRTKVTTTFIYNRLGTCK